MQLSSILVVEGNNATRCQLFICLFRETGTFLFVSINKIFFVAKLKSRKCQDIPVSYGSFVSCPAVYRF